MLACVLQALAVPFGSAISDAFGWRAEFVALGCFGGFTGIGLYVVASRRHIEACEPKVTQTQHALPLLVAEASKVESYGSKVRALLFRSEHRSFQVFLAALGFATATMYMIPMYGMTSIQGELAAGLLSDSDAALVVGATFIGNFFARVTALLLASRVSEVRFTNLGAVFLFLGSLAFCVGIMFNLPYSVSAIFGTTGFVIQIGVGFVMPNCKAGALMGVPDSYVSAANSLVKLAQLVFTAAAQLLATVVNCTASVDRFAMLLLAWNSVGTAGLAYWSCCKAR